MIKIELPANRPDLAKIFGDALHEVAKLSTDIVTIQSPEISSFVEGEKDDTLAVDRFDPDEEKDDTRKDTKDVAFSSLYCSQATQPFYLSGKRTGQWKKRKGIDYDTYDGWYAKQLLLLSNENTPPPPFASTNDTPKNCGEFVGWIARKQADGELTQPDINDAYEQCDLTVADLLPPNPEDKISQRISDLYNFLDQK